MAPRRAPIRALAGVLGAIILVLGGLWLGGHPSDLPSPLRDRFFESQRTEPAVDQALRILTTRYYRPLSRSSLVDHGLSGMVASLDDRYSRYLDPREYRESQEELHKQTARVASGRVLHYHGVTIGYLRLTTFSKDSAEQLRTEVQTVVRAHAGALILDLRKNGGGLVDQAIDIASIFIPHGVIMSAEERGRPRRVYMAREDAIAAGLPMVVLVDHGTASSAEIVTGALQDHGRARVVGTHTYGKGVFQQMQPLSNGGALDITIGQFFTPDGHNVGGAGARQGVGITPNIYAMDRPSTSADEALRVAESTVAAKVR